MSAHWSHFPPEHARVMSNVTLGHEGGCWLFTGFIDPGGYARIWVRAKHTMGAAHRITYEHFRGPIPDGLTLDHLCRVRHCVNPWHLEAVTMRENNLRGDSPTSKNARLTACPKCGGPYKYDGWSRKCSPCRLAYFRKYNSARRAS